MEGKEGHNGKKTDVRMSYRVEVTCPSCEEVVEVDWLFGDDVRCPLCQKLWQTEWDTDTEDNIYGPWITGPAEENQP